MKILLFIVITIVIVFIYTAINRHFVLKSQVDIYGGMQNKYRYLIKNLMLGDDSEISVLKRDFVQITSPFHGIMIEIFTIQEQQLHVEITHSLYISNQLKLKKRWQFKHDYPQDKMLEKIDSDFETDRTGFNY